MDLEFESDGEGEDGLMMAWALALKGVWFQSPSCDLMCHPFHITSELPPPQPIAVRLPPSSPAHCPPISTNTSLLPSPPIPPSSPSPPIPPSSPSPPIPPSSPSPPIPPSSSEVIAAPSVHKYELNYVTSHKGRTLVSTFSRDGEELRVK